MDDLDLKREGPIALVLPAEHAVFRLPLLFSAVVLALEQTRCYSFLNPKTSTMLSRGWLCASNRSFDHLYISSEVILYKIILSVPPLRFRTL